MHRYRFLSVAILFCAAALSAQQQPGMSPPPPPLDPEKATRAPQQETIRRRIGLIELQRQADDLARTAQTIPSDVASIRKGMLPKDVIEKLKQIEKLSKRMRAELNP
jgi:hypothetical protein